ncbi:MAG TPA: molybdopterin cofactor-binding domain-containing protein, partial [Roseivirga sp.]
MVIGTGYVTKSIWRRYLTEFANTVESPYLGGTDPSLWFELTIYNEVIIHSTKVEMGQGAFTGLAQIAAEELDFDVARIKVEHAESI